MARRRIKTLASFEVYGFDIEMPVIISFEYTDPVPARLYPIDKAHPAEGGCVEDVEVEILDDLPRMAKKIQEAIEEAVDQGCFEEAVQDAIDEVGDRREAARENYEDWKRELREEQALC